MLHSDEGTAEANCQIVINGLINGALKNQFPICDWQTRTKSAVVWELVLLKAQRTETTVLKGPLGHIWTSQTITNF